MGEVVPLAVDSALDFTGEPNEELVSELEGMLSDAQSGHLRAVAYASVDRDRAIVTTWCGNCDRHDMMAGVAKLNHRLFTRFGDE